MRRLSFAAIMVLLFAVDTRSEIPRPLGWVSDFAGMLDKGNINTLSRVLTSIKAGSGIEIAVVTQYSLGEYGSIDEMGLAYLEGWGIGRQGKDDGLLILIVYDKSTDYKGYRFETGYGLEGDLPDGLLGQIGREELVPRFRDGDFGGGVLAAVIRIGNILGVDLNVEPPAAKKSNGGRIAPFIIFLILFLLLGRGRRGSGLFWLFLLGGLGGPKRGGGFGGGGFGGGGFGGFGGGGGGGGAGGSW